MTQAFKSKSSLFSYCSLALERWNKWRHCLSQQGVWVPFWTPKLLKRTPQDTQIFWGGISKNLNLKFIIEFFHLLIIPMTLFNDIMPNFDEFIHVYGWNMSILWSPLKIWTPKNVKTANFRHPVSKSWLRHWVKTNKIHLQQPESLPCFRPSRPFYKYDTDYLMRINKAQSSWQATKYDYLQGRPTQDLIKMAGGRKSKINR